MSHLRSPRFGGIKFPLRTVSTKKQKKLISYIYSSNLVAVNWCDTQFVLVVYTRKLLKCAYNIILSYKINHNYSLLYLQNNTYLLQVIIFYAVANFISIFFQ